MTKRSGRDRRVSVYFPPLEGERRAYQDRRAESVPEEVGKPSCAETTEPPKVVPGLNGRGRHVAIAILILATVLIVSL
ncbi:MAG: hypothetical protein QNI91_11730 [Arenicellales bacterium]|nr:hypothetical protein [Arenicellales bacterium]